MLLAGEIYITFTFLGGSGWAYGEGGPAFYILSYGCLAYVMSYWLLPAVWRYAKEHRLHSQSDFFEKKYESKGLGVFVSLVAVVAMVPYLALQFQGLGLIVSSVSYASQALHESFGARLSAGERAYFDPHLAAARAQLGEEAWKKAQSEGRAMTPEQAVEYALRAGEPSPSESGVAREHPAGERPDEPLTCREQEVAVLVARGLTNRRIGAQLSISEHTAATHIARILKKLGLHSRSQLTAWVIDHGLPPSVLS